MADFAADDLFFREIVRSYVEAPRFLRRDWLSAEILGRLDAPGCRLALLTAEPGAGKSAFMAQLANDHPDWLRSFIRRDQRTPLGEGGARSFLLRIGFQLAATRPELFALDQIRIEVEQRIGVARGDVVGATIERIRASPFHQTVVRITQEVGRADGPVAGLRVAEWIADPRLIELDDLQQMALFAPARSLLRVEPEARIVILIDALDELRFGEEDGNLLQWLANGPPLPENVRIVLTSRPSHAQLDAFVQKRSESLAVIRLDGGDRRMQDDIRAYAVALVAPAGIGAALQETGRTAQAFVAELVTRADGNIGYAAALGRAFDRALQNPEQRGLLVQLLGLAQLPDDTQQLFAFFLRLIQAGPGAKAVKVTDPNTGRAALLDAWPELYHPVLAVLAVALQPLTLDEIAALSGTLAARSQVGHALGWLEQFLDKVGERYRLYHATFAAFLTAAETRASAQTSDLWVDANAEHRRVARVLEGERDLDLIWQDSPDAGEQGRRDYARRHYITHLYLGEDWERLTAVVENGAYGRGKLRFDRSTYLYARDLDLALRAVTRAGLSDEERVVEVPRLWSFKLLRSTLAGYAGRLPGSAYQALALIGNDRQAEDLAELISDPQRQAVALLGIAPVLAARPEDDARAAALACRAGEIAARVEDARSRAALLRALLDISEPIEPASEAARAVRRAALDLARSFPDVADRAEALANAALALQAAGESAEALEIRAEIRSFSRTAPDERCARSALYSYCALSVELGDDEAAFSAASAESDPASRLSILADLAERQQRRAMTGIELTRAAIEALRSAAPPGLPRARADAVLAELHLRERDEAGATPLLADALEHLHDEPARVDISAALEVARAFGRTNDRAGFEAAVRIVQEAGLADLPEPGPDPNQGFTLSMRAAQAARGLAELDRCEQALEIVRKLNSYERGSLLLAVVESLARRGEFDRALAIADEIRLTRRQSMMRVSIARNSAEPYADDDEAAFGTLSSALAAAADWPRALEVAEKLTDAQARIDAFSRVAILQFHAGNAQAAADLVTRTMRDVRLGSMRAGRDETLGHVAELFVRAREWSQAREVARSIESPSTRSETQAAIERALIEAGEFDAAQQMLAEVPPGSVRAESLLALVRKVHAVGGTPSRPVDNLTIARMLRVAQAYAQEEEEKAGSAAALRSIALAHVELHTLDVDAAFAALRASVDAMNAVPRFQFVPTPWCDTALAFAKLGGWDMALQIAVWRVESNPFDGCSALRDLGAFAGESGDVERAKTLFAQAQDHARRIQIPPQRFELLASIAKEYTRIGLLQEARDIARASGSPGEAQAQIAEGLLQSGKIAAALEAIAECENAATDRQLARLAYALLAAGEFERASSLVARIADPLQRAEGLVQVARSHISAGRLDEARKALARAVELSRTSSDPWAARRVREALPAVFAELGDDAAARRYVTELWLAAGTRADLLALIALAGPLVPHQPELPQQIHASFAWVEEMLLAV